MKSTFLVSKGLLCLYDKQNDTWLLVDMEFLFSCLTRQLTSERSIFSSVRCINVTSVSVEKLARTQNTAVGIFFGKIGNTFNWGYLQLKIIWLPNICSS